MRGIEGGDGVARGMSVIIVSIVDGFFVSLCALLPPLCCCFLFIVAACCLFGDARGGCVGVGFGASFVRRSSFSCSSAAAARVASAVSG